MQSNTKGQGLITLTTDFGTADWFVAKRQGDAICGQVIYIDHFGNAITNLSEEACGFARSTAGACLVGRVRYPLGDFYGTVPLGRPVGVWGSSGFLEIAVNGGNAARRLGLKVGSTVKFFPKPMLRNGQRSGGEGRA